MDNRPYQKMTTNARSKSVFLVLLFIVSLIISISLPYTLITAQAQDAPPITFVAAGDFGATNNTKAVLTGMSPANSGANFAVALGDFSYGDVTPESAWCNFVTSHVGETFPFELLAGNHESDSPPGNNIDAYTRCLPDKIGNIQGRYSREYYFDYPAENPLARFLMISPGITFLDQGTYDYSAGTPHYAWVESAIDSARAAGIRWLVVSAHEPCHSVGKYPCSISTDLTNLLIDKKVDLVLQGHEHSYQRTKQLTLQGSCTSIPINTYNADCVVANETEAAYTKHKGTVFAIVGTGGKNLYSINTSDPEKGFFAAWSGVGNNPSYGFLKVSLDAAALTAQFVPVSGIFTDTFTIRDEGTPAPTPLPSLTSTPTLPERKIFVAHVATSSDDAEEAIQSRKMNLTSSDLDLILDGSTRQLVGMRFADIPLPHGARVISASIEFEVDKTHSQATSLTFHGQAADQAATFSSVAGDISSRPKTTAQVAWERIPAWNVVGATKSSPDLAPVIQEIIDREGWASGNALTIIITGSGHRTARSFNGSPVGAPKLIISYVDPVAPTPTVELPPTPTAELSPTP